MTAFTGKQVTVGTAPTPIVTVTGGGTLLVSNGGAQTVYLGGANVTTGTGFPLAAAAVLPPFPVLAPAGATLYGIVAATTAVVGTLTAS